MVALKLFFRRFIVANLLLASLLFPTLHFHPVNDHAHESDAMHRHEIVHAHFLLSLADNDNGSSGIHHDDIEPHEQGNEIGLVALSSQKITGSNQPFQKQLYYLADEQRQLVITTFLRAATIKHESPPHSPELYHPGSPRSPPSLV
jgi:hypothetical protein